MSSRDEDGGVTELQLRDNGLSGEIPSELGSLTDLRILRLDQNDLRGEIPLEPGKLSNLERLVLFENDLTGEIPRSLGISVRTHIRWFSRRTD